MSRTLGLSKSVSMLKMLTKETNEEGVSPARLFFEGEHCEVRPQCLFYWRYFIANLAILGYFTATTAYLQTSPIMIYEEREGITILTFLLINSPLKYHASFKTSWFTKVYFTFITKMEGQG